jgi:hypothetical protein
VASSYQLEKPRAARMMLKRLARGGVGELGIEGTSRWRYRPATSSLGREGRCPGDPGDDDATVLERLVERLDQV